MESHKSKKTARPTPSKEDVTQSILENVFIGQLDELRNISAENARTAQAVRKALDEAIGMRINVDTTEFERLTHSAVFNMEKQIRYLKQPPLVLKVIIMMFITSVISVLLAGYFYKELKEYKESSRYWYEQYEEAAQKKK